jgi:pyruvate dehydrogenase E1 component
MPEVLAADEVLSGHGVAAEVVCLTSPDLAFRALSARRGLSEAEDPLEDLFPPAATAPVVTVIDGDPSALGFVAGLRPAPIACLGVQGFGQSGGLEELYRHHGLDVDTIVGSAVDLLG